MTVSVPVQVAKGLPVGEAFLLGVVRGWPHKLEHGLPHVCRKSEDVDGNCGWPEPLSCPQAGATQPAHLRNG